MKMPRVRVPRTDEYRGRDRGREREAHGGRATQTQQDTRRERQADTTIAVGLGGRADNYCSLQAPSAVSQPQRFFGESDDEEDDLGPSELVAQWERLKQHTSRATRVPSGEDSSHQELFGWAEINKPATVNGLSRERLHLQRMLGDSMLSARGDDIMQQMEDLLDEVEDVATTDSTNVKSAPQEGPLESYAFPLENIEDFEQYIQANNK